MIAFKRKIFQTILILLPSFAINFFTLSLVDLNNNLSNFSIILVSLFNCTNFFLSYIFYKNSFKVFFIFSFYCLFLFLIFDFTLEKVINKNSIIKEDKNLGWILKKNKEVILINKLLREIIIRLILNRLRLMVSENLVNLTQIKECL